MNQSEQLVEFTDRGRFEALSSDTASNPRFRYLQENMSVECRLSRDPVLTLPRALEREGP